MANKLRNSNIFTELEDRRGKLEPQLRRLANVAHFQILRLESRVTENDLPRAILRGDLRIQRTNYYLRVWEDFRDNDGTPILYGFTYSLGSQDPNEEALFRYECHPDVEDFVPEHTGPAPISNTPRRNNYALNPHFHPGKEPSYPVNRLHYPFQRSERTQVVFSLISWIEIDLVKRFYDSGRVTES